MNRAIALSVLAAGLTMGTGPRGEDESAAIGTMLDGFHAAASKADFEAYFGAWTDASVFLGTDATERWVGREFRDFARPHFEKGKGWTYRPRDRGITLAPGESVAYFDELLENDKLGTCRGSGVAGKAGGKWVVLQYNLSIPIPNDDAAKVVELIRPAPAPKVDGRHRE